MKIYLILLAGLVAHGKKGVTNSRIKYELYEHEHETYSWLDGWPKRMDLLRLRHSTDFSTNISKVLWDLNVCKVGCKWAIQTVFFNSIWFFEDIFEFVWVLDDI